MKVPTTRKACGIDLTKEMMESEFACGAQGEAMPSTREVNFVVTARNPNWQFGNVSLLPGETAQVHASGRWGIVDPPRNGLVGPGGVFSPSGKRFYKPGAPEGCLLILTGDGEILHFNSDTDTITIRVPGPLHFVANDDRAPDFPAQKGFDDNIGSMTVTIRIS